MLTVRMIPINRLARTPDCMAEIPREECRMINVEESYQNSHSREAGSSKFHTSLGQIQAPECCSAEFSERRPPKSYWKSISVLSRFPLSDNRLRSVNGSAIDDLADESLSSLLLRPKVSIRDLSPFSLRTERKGGPSDFGFRPFNSRPSQGILDVLSIDIVLLPIAQPGAANAMSPRQTTAIFNWI